MHGTGGNHGNHGNHENQGSHENRGNHEDRGLAGDTRSGIGGAAGTQPSGPSRGKPQGKQQGKQQGKHGRASQRIVEQLRRSIREQQLVPGDRLPPERELCERYGVSRVTVREALRVLEANGLVDIRLGSRGGAFVRSPAAGDAAGALADYLALSGITSREIQEVCLALEPGLVPLACERASEDDLEDVGHAYDELERAWREGRYDARAVQAFHVNLARAAGNTAAELLLRPLYDALAHPHGEGEERHRYVDAHRLLFDALRQRDTDLATTRMRAVIERSPT